MTLKRIDPRTFIRELRRDLADGKVSFFVGAGVSMLEFADTTLPLESHWFCLQSPES